MATEHEKLIGVHPTAPNLYGAWLTSQDMSIPDDQPNKKHRKLIETGNREQAIDQIANLLIQHHIDPKKIQRIKGRKEEILKKYNIPNLDGYIDFMNVLPKDPITRSGNGAEIILTSYLEATSGMNLLVYRLRYNTNVEQSIKGDDCLLFNLADLTEKVMVGEAKFRGTSPDPKAIKEMIGNLEGTKRLPISLSYVSQILTNSGEEEKAQQIEDLLFELRNGKIPVVNVGLLMSTKSHTRGKDASLQVEHYLESKNPYLIVLSLGLDNPNEIITKAFDIANQELLKAL